MTAIHQERRAHSLTSIRTCGDGVKSEASEGAGVYSSAAWVSSSELVGAGFGWGGLGGAVVVVGGALAGVEGPGEVEGD